jgi:hypothetical protein
VSADLARTIQAYRPRGVLVDTNILLTEVSNLGGQPPQQNKYNFYYYSDSSWNHLLCGALFMSTRGRQPALIPEGVSEIAGAFVATSGHGERDDLQLPLDDRKNRSSRGAALARARPRRL